MPVAREMSHRRTGALSRLVRLAAVGFVLATACASTPPGAPVRMNDVPPLPQSEQQRAVLVGEIVASIAGGGKGASYGPWRVYGSTVDLTYAGSSWSGTLGGRPTQLTVAPGKIEGAGVNLFVTQEKDAVTVRGTFNQRQVLVTITPDSMRGRTASNAPGFEVTRSGPAQYAGNWGPGRMMTVSLNGDAAKYPAAMTPQFYLALLGVLL